MSVKLERFLWFFLLMLLQIASFPVRWLALSSSGSFLMSRTINICSSWKSCWASALKNAILSYFTILKSYFINYTIPCYNTPYIQKLYYFTFSLKYYFFNLSLLFLSHHHFFSTKGWNKIYIFFSTVLQYNSKFRIVL